MVEGVGERDRWGEGATGEQQQRLVVAQETGEERRGGEEDEVLTGALRSTAAEGASAQLSSLRPSSQASGSNRSAYGRCRASRWKKEL